MVLAQIMKIFYLYTSMIYR